MLGKLGEVIQLSLSKPHRPRTNTTGLAEVTVGAGAGMLVGSGAGALVLVGAGVAPSHSRVTSGWETHPPVVLLYTNHPFAGGQAELPA